MGNPRTPEQASRATPRMDRRIARILEILSIKQMTAKELSQTMHVSHDTARDYLSILHEQQRVYVAAWQPVDRNKPAKVYAAGSNPDVIYVPAPKTKIEKKADIWKEKVLTALALPSTTYDLAKRLGISYSYTRFIIYALKQEGSIHVRAWILPHPKGSRAAVYAVGNEPSKERISFRRMSREEQRVARDIKPNTAPKGIFSALGL